jgi:hypothetical protein
MQIVSWKERARVASFYRRGAVVQSVGRALARYLHNSTTNLNALSVQCRCNAAGGGCCTFRTVVWASWPCQLTSALGSWELTTASLNR